MNIHKLTKTEAREIGRWKYEEPYSLYDFSEEEETMKELLNGTYYGCCNENGELIGYFCFGESAQVPGGREANLYGGEGVIDIGLGMKPELTGQGRGKEFFQAGIQFAIHAFQPQKIRLSVAAFNERAIMLYKNVGFKQQVVFISREKKFLLMVQSKLDG
ncbi:GNAT family protein [Bacillus cytotoxicus]|uniref:GNAT family N-acetyltransferase n=1 Tax=Bacillus cereus group sp. BfR-BA-01492 TaxID=2920361 RepID=UPI001F56527F|nr:GNAT family protein [Bacillus cereus group sp. BfR-BA-01492]EMA6342311.1 GNAT family N-acetyltransferase [Bacillus cytotoxicus]